MAECLARRISEANERQCILSVLAEATKIVRSEQTSDTIRYNILDAIICRIHPSFTGFLTTKELRSVLAQVFEDAPFGSSISILLHRLRDSSSFQLQHLITLIDAVEERGLRNALVQSVYVGESKSDSADLDKVEQIRCLFRTISKVPSLLYNAAGKKDAYNEDDKLSEMFSTFLENHWLRLVTGIKEAVQLARERIEGSCDVDMRLISPLLSSLSSNNLSAFQQVIKWLESQSQTPIWSRLCSRLLTDDSNGALSTETLILRSAEVATNGKALLNIFGSAIVQNNVVQRVLFYKMLIVKVYPPENKIPQKLADVLRLGNTDATCDGLWSRLHCDTVLSVLDVFTSKSHITYSDEDQRSYIDVALLCLVRGTSDPIREQLRTRVHEKITTGIQYHLDCANLRRRTRGMFVAETLTNWLNIGALKFDYSPEMMEELHDLRRITGDEKDDSESIDCQNLLPSNKVECNIKKELPSPTAVDSDNELLDSDDDDFPSYTIPKEELNVVKEPTEKDGEKKEKAPKYIRECLEGLQEGSNFSRFEACFFALNAMIRSRAVAYDDICDELLRKVIFLTDRFKTEKFQERRLEIMCSCLVMSPRLAPMAIDILYSRNCSMYHRYSILESLVGAARELSSCQKKNQDNPKIVEVKHDGKRGNTKDEGEDWRRIIDERLELKTKYFRTKNTSMPLTSINRFGDVAGVFFYPLSRIFVDRIHLDLLGTDYTLLGKILLVLGEICI
ncbi:hypothetical protein AB6A40_003661, partial [Gnathostoma spinigerum]